VDLPLKLAKLVRAVLNQGNQTQEIAEANTEDSLP
jgi:hypothetical protein